MNPNKQHPKHSVPLLEEAMTRYPEEKNTPFSTIMQFLFKRAAKHLAAHLKARHSITLTHGQALDALSAGLGFADWNTAKSVVEQAAENEEARPVLAAPLATPVSQIVHRLTHLLDFATSSLVVGPAGCGKSVGLLFAVQRARALEQGRPVVIIRGPESSRYQPNWGNVLALFDSVDTLEQIDTTKDVRGTDKLDVRMADGLWGMDAVDRERRHEEVVTGILNWLQRRAHLNPLVLVDEAPSVLGAAAARLVGEAPASATFTWAAQCLADAGDIDLLSTKFRSIYLMRGSDRSVGAELGRLVKEDSRLVKEDHAQVLDAIRSLSVGDAIQLTIHRVPQAT